MYNILYNGGERVISVIQQKKGGEVCALCGEPIKPGTVFVIRHVTASNGLGAWLFCHLWCDAARRGAHKERLREPRRLKA